jgi:tryptophan 2,3-dioxygenase
MSDDKTGDETGDKTGGQAGGQPAQSRGKDDLGGRFEGETYHADMKGQRSYHDFLELDKILNAQPNITGEHDEMLFFVLHQVKELWMKLMIHELEAAMPHIQEDNLRPAFKIFARVKRIQENLLQAWHILTTMTPTDYLAFRDGLGQSSGFQSFQNRSIEFLFGNKNRAMIRPHSHRPHIVERLTELIERPSIYDEVVMLLARRGFKIDQACLERDWSEVREPNQSVMDAWKHIYHNPEESWGLYELAEDLLDMDDIFQTWRFRHANTVERVIGHKIGTGGTSGVGYLRKAVDIRLFPELWMVRTEL